MFLGLLTDILTSLYTQLFNQLNAGVSSPTRLHKGFTLVGRPSNLKAVAACPLARYLLLAISSHEIRVVDILPRSRSWFRREKLQRNGLLPTRCQLPNEILTHLPVNGMSDFPKWVRHNFEKSCMLITLWLLCPQYESRLSSIYNQPISSRIVGCKVSS